MTSTHRLVRRTALALGLTLRTPVLLLGLLAMAVILPTVLLLTADRGTTETVTASAGQGCVVFACDQAPAVHPAAAEAARPAPAAPPAYPFQSAPAAAVHMDLGDGGGWHMNL
jgi:hypothetical protein